MSLQWTLLASFLYTEVALVLLLVVPVPSAKRWQGIFRSRFLNFLRRQAYWYSAMVFIILMLFVVDSIREMRKYSGYESGEAPSANAQELDLESQVSIKMFKAQRNFYMAGFALFLSFVIRRLFFILTAFAALEIQSRAALRAAGIIPDCLPDDQHEKEVADLKNKLTKLMKELEAERVDKELLRKQAGTLNKQYEKLSEEYSMLADRLRVLASETDIIR